MMHVTVYAQHLRLLSIKCTLSFIWQNTGKSSFKFEPTKKALVILIIITHVIKEVTCSCLLATNSYKWTQVNTFKWHQFYAISF